MSGNQNPNNMPSGALTINVNNPNWVVGVACYGDSTKRYTMTLPEKTWPSAIYLGGIRKTVGIIGTNAEVQIAKDQAIFARGDIGALRTGNQYSIIFEFKNATYYYHYNGPSFPEERSDVKLELKPVFVARRTDSPGQTDSLWTKILRVIGI